MACSVCGDRVNGSRYGAPACLGCIVFFRRAICKSAKYKCTKEGNCRITSESRCICRCCRFEKCLQVGMKADAIQRRDVMGPRKKKKQQTQLEATSPMSVSPLCDSVASSSSLSSEYGSESLGEWDMTDYLMKLQDKQWKQHKATAAMIGTTLTWDNSIFDTIDQMIYNPPFRRARKWDVNFMLRTALLDAAEWANQFKPFKNIDIVMKKNILSEFGFAFMLVDQGYITARKSVDGHWMLQNNTYMCPDYMKGLPEKDQKLKEVETKAKLHPIFVQDALDSVGDPFRRLNIDKFECAVIKTILLLGHRNFFGHTQDEIIGRLQNRVISELMTYCKKHHPEQAIERVGEVLLQCSSVRCAIRSLYNQTRVSDLFNLMTFNSLIRDVYLT